MSFFTTQVKPVSLEEEQEGLVPRDRWNRPLIILPDGSGKTAPYARASSFGGVLEDKSALEKWGKRQMLRGAAIEPSIIDRVPHGPARERGGEISYNDKKILNTLVEAADEAVGSSDKASLGTAIHYGTELVDLGGDLSVLSDHVRERADAYHRFCKTWGLRMTSVERFGVEDENRVAGTWDRTGVVPWKPDVACILDVKTSSTMDFAGIGFGVQLAEYAHMSEYDPATGRRTPHENMDLSEAWIIHIGRNMGDPVELFRVDIARGWKYARLVAEVKAARKAGKYLIEPMSWIRGAILGAQSREEILSLWESYGEEWTEGDKKAATRRQAEVSR